MLVAQLPNSVIDKTASQSTKLASEQVAGYPAKAGIQIIKCIPQRGTKKVLSAVQAFIFCWIPAFTGMTARVAEC